MATLFPRIIPGPVPFKEVIDGHLLGSEDSLAKCMDLCILSRASHILF